MKDNKFLEDNPALERYFRLCCRMYERMERENSFPWVVNPEVWAEYEKTGDTQVLKRFEQKKEKEHVC